MSDIGFLTILAAVVVMAVLLQNRRINRQRDRGRANVQARAQERAAAAQLHGRRDVMAVPKGRQ